MQVVGTREAFMALISQRGVYKLLDVDRSTVANWKAYLREGKSISLDKMEEMLLKAGASVVSEKVWDVAVTPFIIKTDDVMEEFCQELESKKIGDEIIVDTSAGVNITLAFSEICEHAKKINARVTMANISPKVFGYTFSIDHESK